jgi:hypothetical protein
MLFERARQGIGSGSFLFCQFHIFFLNFILKLFFIDITGYIRTNQVDHVISKQLLYNLVLNSS